MLSNNMLSALNLQIKHEYSSSYLYLAMSAYCAEQNLLGFAKWLKVQSDEEREHAMKIYDFILDNNAQVQLDAIDKPPAKFGTPKAMFAEVLKHEQFITASIHKLYDLAVSEKDYRTQIMLQWFVTEQMEEEANAMAILARIEAVEEKMSAVLWIDKELGKRAGA